MKEVMGQRADRVATVFYIRRTGASTTSVSSPSASHNGIRPLFKLEAADEDVRSNIAADILLLHLLAT